MKTVRELPCPVREIENCWIPLQDGTRLAARIWLPESASESPVPAVLEYIPYRKRDRTRWRDEPMHRYFAGHGYAALRVDLRGSGDSDGLLLDEYLELEQTDGVEVIRWIAAQSWCSGAVGMIGKSWGGFNALQIAALAPPELAAVISVCSTDDRYADDAHYMGGCLLNENLTWGSVLFTLTALPPDPELVGARWREMWLARLAATPLFPEIWLSHQRRDEYWRQGSVCEHFERIRCPVYTVGGWADGYSNAVPRLMAGLSSPRKGLVGPWAHVYPHNGVPGPAIGFLQEALSWWDRWLRGDEVPALDEEPYRVWMQASARPPGPGERQAGRWVAEESWPSARIRPRGYVLVEGRLVAEGSDAAGSRDATSWSSPQTVGSEAGAWCGFGLAGDAPADQGPDDAGSLVFDTEPLGEGFEMLGAPTLVLRVASDRPQALIAVRLNEVAPDGSSRRITYGLLNLTHRGGHEEPELLTPGEAFDVRIELNDIAQAVPAGSRLRLALSTSYWPVAWPSPEVATLTLDPAHCRLELPVRPPRAEDADLRAFEAPEAGAASEVTELVSAEPRRTVSRDGDTGAVTYTVELDADEDGAPALERLESTGLVQGHSMIEHFHIHPDDPLSARAETLHKAVLRRGAWSARVETRVELSATLDEYVLEAELDAWEQGERVFTRRWNRRVPRDPGPGAR